ncbi:MAG: alpha/beta hydrolase [Burkholderiaceae bacterium]|nr:alpha/beta hydrolase [Burkholderiaceae bacterium]
MSFTQKPLATVRLADGAVLSYVREGRGPVLIFVHGVLGDWRSWEAQWPFFTRHYDCIAYSCRFNHPNGNTMAAPDHSAVENAADLEGLMDALGIESAILVGSSYGGFTSLAMGLRAPQRVRAIVAVEPPMMKYAEMFDDTAPVAAAFREQAVVPSRDAFAQGDDELGTTLLTGGIANRPADSLPTEVMRRRMENRMAGRRVALSSDEFPLLDPKALAASTIPTMLMTGRNTGPIFKAIFSGITRVMTQARLEVVEGAGHSVAGDQPQAFNALVLDFLGRLD